MTDTSKHAVVVGGGIIGIASAHFLLAAGWRVTIIDRGRFGAGCSDGNCGFICPSHVLPLAEPGAVTQALQALLKPGSPFTIKPRIDLALWRWLINFASRCHHQAMIKSATSIRPLLDSSLTLYNNLLSSGDIDCDWQQKGLLFAFRRPSAFNAYAATDWILRDHFDRPSVRLEGEALTDFEPALRSGLAGGYLYEGDAHLRPEKLLASWGTSLERSGVTIRENCSLTGLVTRDQAVRTIHTTTGDISADAVVLATGALTPALTHILAHPLPIQPGKGYSITMPRPEISPSTPCLFPETKVAATPFKDGYRLGSTMEFAGYDETIPLPRLRLLVEGAKPFLRTPSSDPIKQRWFGWRPMTPDGLPLIGTLPHLTNLVLATGHNMLGLSMAPATGLLVSEILSGLGAYHIDPRPYSPNRYL